MRDSVNQTLFEHVWQSGGAYVTNVITHLHDIMMMLLVQAKAECVHLQMLRAQFADKFEQQIINIQIAVRAQRFHSERRPRQRTLPVLFFLSSCRPRSHPVGRGVHTTEPSPVHVRVRAASDLRAQAPGRAASCQPGTWGSHLPLGHGAVAATIASSSRGVNVTSCSTRFDGTQANITEINAAAAASSTLINNQVRWPLVPRRSLHD